MLKEDWENNYVLLSWSWASESPLSQEVVYWWGSTSNWREKIFSK